MTGWINYDKAIPVVVLLVVVVGLLWGIEVTHAGLGDAGCSLELEYVEGVVLDDNDYIKSIPAKEISDGAIFLQHNVERAVYHCPNGKTYGHWSNASEHPDVSWWHEEVGP